MKYILAVLLVIGLLISPTPAKANDEDVVIGIIGGAIGGLIIGSAIERDRYYRRHRYYEDPYYYDEPPVRRCFYRIYRVYDPEWDAYVRRERRVCY